MKPRKIRINKTEYIESKHLIMWQITYVDESDPEYGKDVTLAYRANDIADAVLGKKGIKITADQALTFNREISGKTINLVEIYDSMNHEDVLNGSVEDFTDRSMSMREYPFEEVYDILKGE